MVTFLLLARPLILILSGAEDAPPRLYRVASGFSYEKKGSRTEYIRARLKRAADGWTAEKFPRDGAGILTSMVESDGLVEIGEGVSHIALGSDVDFLPFSEVIA